MPYAVIVKRKRKFKDVVKNEKLKKKLGRELNEDEIKYIEYESTKYICMVGFRTQFHKCHVTKTIYKSEAIFYTEEDLPYVQIVMGKTPYTIIDVKTGEEYRLPADISVIEEPETVGDVKDINTLKIN
jgi:hypothetical protein